MNKRTAHVTAAVTPELEIAAKAMAALEGVTLSDLINRLLMEHIEEKRRIYLSLSSIFSNTQDLLNK